MQTTHDWRVQCCLGYTEAVELVCFNVRSGQSLLGLITASVRILDVLVPAEAVDRTGLVLAFKLGVGAGCENGALVNICEEKTQRVVMFRNTVGFETWRVQLVQRPTTCAVLPVSCKTRLAGAGVVVFSAGADGVLVAGERVRRAAHV